MAAPEAVPVIHTHGLGKVYSAGTEAEVVALRGVDLRIDARRVRRDHGPVRFRQVHPDEPDRLPGHAHQRLLRMRRRGRGDAGRRGAGGAAPRQDRLRVPGLPPVAADERAPTTWRCRWAMRSMPPAERRRARSGRAGGGGPGRARRALAPTSCPAASSSASRSPARWSTSRRSCWPTNPPARWTARPARRSWRCSSACATTATPSS